MIAVTTQAISLKNLQDLCNLCVMVCTLQVLASDLAPQFNPDMVMFGVSSMTAQQLTLIDGG